MLAECAGYLFLDSSLASNTLEIFLESRVVGVLRGGGTEFVGSIGEAALFFEDERELPVGGAVVGSTGLGLVGKVLAEIALGARQICVRFQQGYGSGKERRGIVRNTALRLGKDGVKIVPVLLVGQGGGEVDIAGGAAGIGGDGLAGEMLGLSVTAVAVAVEDGSEIDDGAIEARIELHGAAEERLNLRQRTLLHLQERGFGESSIGGTDLVDLLQGFAGFGLGATDDHGRLLVESHGFLETADVTGIELEREVEFVTHLAGERDSAAKNPNLSARSPRVSASWQ